MLARKAKRLATGVGRLARKVGEPCVQGKRAGGPNSEACTQGKKACDRVSEAARKGREVGKPTDPRFAVIAIEGLTIVGLTRGDYASHAFIFQPSSRRTPGSIPQRTHTVAAPAALGVPALHTRSLRSMGPGLRRDDDLWGGRAPPPRHSNARVYCRAVIPSNAERTHTVAAPAALGVPTRHTLALRRMGPGLRRDDDLWGGRPPPPRHSNARVYCRAVIPSNAGSRFLRATSVTRHGASAAAAINLPSGPASSSLPRSSATRSSAIHRVRTADTLHHGSAVPGRCVRRR